MEVLFTIENKLGSSCPQFSEMNTDLISYAQEAFGVSQKIHEHLLGVASGEKVFDNGLSFKENIKIVRWSGWS